MRAIRKYFQRYWKYKIQQTKEELNTMKIGNDIYYVWEGSLNLLEFLNYTLRVTMSTCL